MTLDQVSAEVEAWAKATNGRYIDHDKAYGPQCVDAALYYASAVHGYERIRGHGIALAGNYVAKYGWKSMRASAIQPGDMISLSWGGTYGHVLIALSKLSDGRWRILDQNSKGTGDDPSGPCEIRTVSLSSGVVTVARPPRYYGATATAAVPAPSKPTTPTQILSSMPQGKVAGPLFNADLVVKASAATGIPLHVVAAFVHQESGGQNIYGHDYGGIHSTNPSGITVRGTYYPAHSDVPVTSGNYADFLARVLNPNGSWTGATSNGVGLLQITYWAFHRDARAQGINLADPYQGLLYGLKLLVKEFGLGTNYSEANIKLVATRYNAGPQATTVNSYGESVWAKAEAYRAALGAAATTPPAPGEPTPTPTPEPTPEPIPDPEADFTPQPPAVDPGPRPELAAAVIKPAVLPNPPSGPAHARRLLTEPMARVWWREQWWTPLELDIKHDMAIPGPDQSPIGADLVEAEGKITLARPLVLSHYGWDQVLDAPPAPGEPVRVEITDDGGLTWVTRFVGVVDGADGAADEVGMSLRVVQDVDALDGRIRHAPLNFRHPSPDNGARYMGIGLHPVYVANVVARNGGYYATPPAPADCTMLSVPMMGSVWPEYGSVFASFTRIGKSATAGLPADSPEYRAVPWGLTVTDVFARWRPRLPEGVTGKLDRPLGIRFLASSTTADPVHLEFFWDRVSIMVQVRDSRVIIETQTGWNSDGTRVVRFSRTRGLTPEQQEDGFEFTMWVYPDGRLTTEVDGVRGSHTPFPSFPGIMKLEPMTEVRLTSRPTATQIGGLVVVSSTDTSVLGAWDRTFVARVDPDHMLFGLPAIQNVDGLDLLTELATKALDAVWIDEGGLLHYESRARMDARFSLRRIDRDDLASADWTVSRDSIYTHVGGTHRQPSASQNRMSSDVSTDLWEGPTDTLRPGEEWSEIASPPADTDWIGMDHSFLKLGRGTINSANSGVGSLLPGTTRQSDSEGKVEEGVPSVTWFNGDVTRLGWDAYRVDVRYRPPEGVVAHLALSAPEVEGLSPGIVGKGPILRGRARVKWEEVLTRAIPTGATLRRSRTYTHDGGWCVQSPLVMGRIISRLAAMYATPLRTYRGVELAEPDLGLRLGDTVTLALVGPSKPYRVCGINLTLTPDEGLTQRLSLRQLRP